MEIVRGVHVIDLGMVNAYVYQEADRLTLIDTGLATHAARILNEMDGLGRQPEDLRQIVATHYHADHVGALAELTGRTGASVLVHALDAPVVRGETPEPPTKFESDRERKFHERIVADVPPLVPCTVDRELTDGDRVDLDGGSEVVHVPGHTAGSIALFLPRRQVLFTGDAAARDPDGRLMVGVFNVDPAQARRSFARLADLDFDAVFFGHGRPMDRDASLAFRKLAEKLARS